MKAPMLPHKFRGVSCFHCGRPIRLSASSLWREMTRTQREHGSAERWFSKVFSHRCRVCRGEAVYVLERILGFEDQSPNAKFDKFCFRNEHGSGFHHVLQAQNTTRIKTAVPDCGPQFFS